MKKLLIIGAAIFVSSAGVEAATTSAVSPSDDIDAISSIAAALGGSFEFVQPTPSTAGSLTATDFVTLTIENNNNAGYDVDVTATNGKLKSSNNAIGAKTGAEIDYTLACDSYVDQVSATVTAFSATNMSTASTEVYSHADPAEATVSAVPNCDLVLASEDLRDKLADTYTETFTFVITND